MWGTHADFDFCHVLRRFIPTHVGNSHDEAGPAGSLTVHPHACGELSCTSPPVTIRSGSSPRMWGTPFLSFLAIFLLRFIPTHVGNSLSGTRSPGRIPVHPHACGELSLLPGAFPGLAGSSPRMWGTHLLPFPFWPRSRFIPTHVGNSAVQGRVQTD